MINLNNLQRRKYPFIVAEMSGNHNQNYTKAKKIIDAISKSGADAIKFQTFKPEGMTLNLNKKEFVIREKNSLWKNSNLFELYKKSSMKWEWQKKLFSYARKRGLIAFSSPFHIEAVNFLEKINCPIYKIASLENTYFQLIEAVIKTKKPLIISTGATDLDEINKIVKFVKKKGCKNFALLKCTSVYPSKRTDLNLDTIPELSKKFKCLVGFSDHTVGTQAAEVAVSLGAKIIEKHVMLDKYQKTVDSDFSMTSSEFNEYVKRIKQVIDIKGKKNVFFTKFEKYARTRKRSIYISEKIEKNQIISEKNIKIIRPGNGLATKFFKTVIGKKINKTLYAGTPLKLKYLKKL